MANMEGAKPSDGFDRIYRAINTSRVYREAVRASRNGLPEWLVPFSTINAALLERFATELSVAEGETIVDLACGGGGPGIWIAERSAASLIGVDFSHAAVEAARVLARRRDMSARARFLVADATATGIPDESVAAVMSIDAFMFLDAERVANEIGRLLKSGGVAVATTAESLVDPFVPTLVRDYRPIFEAAGFRIRIHESVAGHVEQQLSLYRALLDRGAALREEIGEPADVLLEEACTGLQRAATKTARVRNMLLVAERV